jgi:RNA polymerase sigma factor (sigma-70 family)
MAIATLTPLVHYLQSIGPSEPDAVLLGRFARQRDGAAFAELVRRHGPVVLGVCHRVLRDGHAAEDAFQATFLLLATKAGALRQPELLGHWLHAVAFRTASKLRGRLWRRQNREHPFDENTHIPREAGPDMRPDLDAAIQQLPSKYRVPVVLCYLNGLTNAEAAARVGCPPNTIATRLARARDRLRSHFTRQGLTVAVSSALIAATARNACALGTESLTPDILTLMEGVRKAMMWNKVKIAVAAVAMIAATGIGIGRVSYGVGAGEPPGPGVPAVEGPRAPTQGDLAPPRAGSSAPVAASPANIPSIDLTKAEVATKNFVVTGASAEWCERIALAAEQQRKSLAKAWLGKELPDWKQPCPIVVQINDRAHASATSFQFGKQLPLTGRELSITGIKLDGTLRQILNILLPHEVTHTILADHFREPIPRWADEGAAMMAENDVVPNRQDDLARKFLKDGMAFRLTALFQMREYPANVGAFFAQSCSVTRFLADKFGKPKFLEFVSEGMKGNWEAATKKCFEFESIADMERTWIAWLRKSMPKAVPPSDLSPASLPQAPLAEIPPPPTQPDPVPPQDPLVTPPTAPAETQLTPSTADPYSPAIAPPPVQAAPSMTAVVASMDKEGRIVCKFPKVTHYEPVTTYVRDTKGITRPGTSYVQRSIQEERGFNPGQLQITGLDGKPVEEKELSKRLEKETPALFITSGSIDPNIRALLKEGSLVITIRQVLPAAPPIALPATPRP